MSRRTFPRAVAAGLIVAALGGPAAGQAPNPWRGETGLPTAPAPRAVAAKPTRQLTIGLGFSSVGGLTGTSEIRDLTPPTAAPVKPPPVLKVEGQTPRTLPSDWITPPTPRYLVYYPTYFPPDPILPRPVELRGLIDPDAAPATPPVILRASHIRVPDHMPPPAPLPVQRIPPAAP
jgi:hypothetical protein